MGKRHPTVREGALVSAHAQVIGPIEIGKNAKVGVAAVVVVDVPEDIYSRWCSAKVVRVHWSKRTKKLSHDSEEGREYYSEKLRPSKSSQLPSSRL